MNPELPHGVGAPDPDPIVPIEEDTFHRVYFGQLSEPLVRPHPEPPEAEEDELTRAALADPAARDLGRPRPEPTAWRWVVLVLGAAGVLWVLFGRR